MRRSTVVVALAFVVLVAAAPADGDEPPPAADQAPPQPAPPPSSRADAPPPGDNAPSTPAPPPPGAETPAATPAVPAAPLVEPPRAEPARPPVGAALLAGGAIAIAPLCGGGALFAQTDDVDARRAGLYLGLTGLTLAPALAHFIVGEPARAGWFSIAPAAGSGLAVAMLEAHPELLDHGSAAVRVLFGAGLSLAIVGAVVGLGDVPGAADRQRRRQLFAGRSR